jgi:hypothetical protein
MDQILRWITTCKAYHTGCRPPAQLSTLPTRLLDLGQSATVDLVKLVESKALREVVKYITLSHSWGERLQCRLTSECFELYKCGIMSSSLPLTFQHAIDLARRLGHRYLWIDALCIIQDDVLDWREEAAKMADVYFNSDLSIAASDSKDSRGGIYRRRNPLATTPCMIPTAYNSSSPECVYAVNPSHRHTQVPLDETHLSTRAWTIQERLLAPRVVHFTHGEVYWECGSGICCETFPEQPLVPHQPEVKKWLATPEGQEPGLDISEDFWDIWSHIVRAYTEAKLTRISDKLVAIAGLARRMHTVAGGTLGRYVAGLWELQFERQLGWCCPEPTEISVSQYIAPTWSWACIVGPVYFADQEIDAEGFEAPIVDCLEVTTQPKSDPFGPVLSGSVTVRGRICKIIIRGEMVTRPPRIMSPVPGIKDLEIAGGPHPLCESEWDSGWATGDGDYIISWDRYSTALEGQHFQAELFLLLLFDLRLPERSKTDRELNAIVLEPTRAKSGQFKRLGFFETTSQRCVTAIEKATESYELETQFYESFDKVSGYTIEII